MALGTLRKFSFALAFGVVAGLAACGSSERTPAGGNLDGGVPGSGDASQIGNIDPNNPDAKPVSIGTLTGKVLMPEGTIPVSDALVYLTSSVPDAIPQNAYCDKCVALDSYAFTYSKPDGTYELPAYKTGDQYLVVQKGQFRRYRTITVAEGKQDVPTGRTTLPGKNNAQLGDSIPKMLVWPGQWDHVERSLKKLGVEEFEMFQPGFDLSAYAKKTKEFPNYHMIFFPCAGSVQLDQTPKCSVTVEPTVLAAAKDFVGKGGKLYVTDWSYEYVRQGWPGAVNWQGESQQWGSACDSTGASGPATWQDASLNAWMTAIGEGSASVQGAWTTLKGVNAVSVVDENGNTVTQTPKVWVSAAGHPTTVSFQDRCGRVLYSTYHTEGTDSAIGGSATLLAQEKALLHVLLEVGVCVGPKPVPPPR